jgi:hypothetical protein
MKMQLRQTYRDAARTPAASPTESVFKEKRQ